jgi:hypothetical protein
VSAPRPTTAVVIARDRVNYLRRCVDALMRSLGVGDIHIVDHASTWPPMLDLLASAGGTYYLGGDGKTAKGRVHVHLLANAHPRDLWTNGTLAAIVEPAERFLVTDCDIEVPTDWRGADWLAELHRLLDIRPDVLKAGLGLSTRTIPPGYEHRDRVVEWEAKYTDESRLRPYFSAYDDGRVFHGRYFESSVDTTVALYRRLEGYDIDPAVRTAHAHHEALHLPWLEAGPETPELAWYRERAEYGHWRQPDGFIDEHK